MKAAMRLWNNLSAAENGPAWLDTTEGRYAQAYLQPLLTSGSRAFAANIDTQILLLETADAIVPVTLNDRQYDSSYVVSPYTHYVSYAIQELQLLRNKPLELLLAGLLRSLGLLFKAAGINRTVQLNNWLLSTNLYPASLTPDMALEAAGLLQAAYPDHTVIFRSLCRTLHGPLLDSLRASGFRLVPSRQIYLWEPSRLNSKARWLLKRDRALLETHGYEPVEHERLGETDVPRLLELYNLLYLDKYSLHNPQFTERFLRQALREQTLRLHALRCRKSGRIDAVLGCYTRGGIMTTPVFGYDTSLPQELGLYRMLSAELLRLAAAGPYLLHESSGAAEFKRNRGAFADIEYLAVYDRHLPLRRRLVWSLLEGVLNTLGVPLMKKRKL
ncbi:GNAT family N-acetyltransferase [Paenibacillus athensensis]|uniref:GNAT family N-acetyltransferase n=1 Tax=Paenibacillus athensensis TaxID=1967502 RepID=A0A4Y8Q671_9BACL|nr:GNAT family N-acetyltransferase [Paenibacillus athensensis]MCD1258476.1 GNAT family N-acetyltransferase [Paenibacillus athensensis]